MALAGLLTAASSVLGSSGLGGSGGEPTGNATARASTTTTTTLAGGSMTQLSGGTLVAWALVILWALSSRRGRKGGD